MASATVTKTDGATETIRYQDLDPTGVTQGEAAEILKNAKDRKGIQPDKIREVNAEGRTYSGNDFRALARKTASPPVPPPGAAGARQSPAGQRNRPAAPGPAGPASGHQRGALLQATVQGRRGPVYRVTMDIAFGL